MGVTRCEELKPPDGSGSERHFGGLAQQAQTNQERIGNKDDANQEKRCDGPECQFLSMDPKQKGRETEWIPNLEAFLLVAKMAQKKPRFCAVLEGLWRVL
jgi:hypothetical protein